MELPVYRVTARGDENGLELTKSGRRDLRPPVEMIKEVRCGFRVRGAAACSVRVADSVSADGRAKSWNWVISMADIYMGTSFQNVLQPQREAVGNDTLLWGAYHHSGPCPNDELAIRKQMQCLRADAARVTSVEWVWRPESGSEYIVRLPITSDDLLERCDAALEPTRAPDVQVVQEAELYYPDRSPEWGGYIRYSLRDAKPDTWYRLIQVLPPGYVPVMRPNTELTYEADTQQYKVELRVDENGGEIHYRKGLSWWSRYPTSSEAGWVIAPCGLLESGGRLRVSDSSVASVFTLIDITSFFNGVAIAAFAFMILYSRMLRSTLM